MPLSRMVSIKKIAGTSPLYEFQSYIGITVLAMSNTKDFTSGTLCLDTGMAVSLTLKKWCNLYGLAIKLKFRVILILASREVLDILGASSMIVLLVPTLEVDLGEEAVSLGDFYKILMGMDIMSDM